MVISKDTVVTLHYKLCDSDNNPLEDDNMMMSYLHGGYDDIFPKVEAGLAGKTVGFELAVALEPDDAFGDYDEELLRVEPLKSFPKNIEVGMQFEGAPDGADEDEMILYTVTDIADGKVVVDGNHPLAGQKLLFSCTVADVRAATQEELIHQHVHGEHGHVH